MTHILSENPTSFAKSLTQMAVSTEMYLVVKICGHNIGTMHISDLRNHWPD